jgi:hypothetical protein
LAPSGIIDDAEEERPIVGAQIAFVDPNVYENAYLRSVDDIVS